MIDSIGANWAMTHIATSRVLEDMIIEFRKKGLPVPINVLTDLKSARVLMKVEQVDQKSRGETTPKIDEYLSSVEAYLVTEAQKKLPPEQVDEWLRRLDAASCDTCVTEEKEESSFITGLPRDQKWIRVEPLRSLPAEKLKQLATETNLSFRSEEDGHLIVYGRAEDIKKFVKKMTEQAAKE
jgi:hypothetical protein